MDAITLAEAAVSSLRERKLTLAVAESCTGGMLSARLTDVPGVSDAFIEGCVTYSNEAKQRRLGVSALTLEEYGAVSAECAAEMARGIAETAGSDIGVAITGIAGPSGGSGSKPVGLVYISVFFRESIRTERCVFSGERKEIREKAVTQALLMLLEASSLQHTASKSSIQNSEG